MNRLFAIALLFVSPALFAQKLLILGTAQDAGKPQIACKKECCKAGTPRAYVVSMALLDPEEMRWTLIEASPNITAQMRKIPPSYPPIPSSVLISHAHIGHYTGLMYFGREALNTHKLPVLCGSRMAAYLRSNGPWSQLSELQNISITAIKASNNSPFIEETIPGSVHLFTVPHRDEFSETLGYLIQGKNKRALFIPDIDKWDLWEHSIIDLLKTVDYAFLDGTFYDASEIPGRDMAEIPHPFVVETMALMRDLPASEKAKVHFIHLNHTNPLWNPDSEAYKQVLESGYNIAREDQLFDL